MAGKVCILGAAGTLGSCTAYEIATRGMADELVLFDINKNLLKCHAMDIETALTCVQNTVIKVGKYSDLADSDVVVVAVGAPWRFISNRMQLLNDSLPIIQSLSQKIGRLCPDAVVITATNPVDPLNYAMHQLSGMNRKKLLGYSLNDSFRFRLITAHLLGVAATAVDGLTVGEHGPHQVILFSSLRVAGQPTNLSEEQRQRVREEIPKALHAYESLSTGRTTGWTSAMGLSAMVSAVLSDSGRVFPASVVLDGEYGYRDLSVGVPVAMGRGGWREVPQVEMTSQEKRELASAMEFLCDAARIVDKRLSQN